MGGWGADDSIPGKYIGHPMQGAIAGYIQVQNDPSGMYQEFGKSPEYWKSRRRALIWAFAYSWQYELGPLSDSAIGNTGFKAGGEGMVDMVTPIIGWGWLVTEDAMDRYVIRKMEQKSQRPRLKAILRTGLNPTRSFANVLRRKAPWHRDTRDGVSVVAGASPVPPPSPPATAPPAPPLGSPKH